MARASKARASAAAEAYGLGLLLLYATLLWTHQAPPSLTDCANWTYQGVLLRNHISGVPDPTHILKSYPVPNSLITVVMGLFDLLLPWRAALRAALSAELLLFYVVLRHIMRTTGGFGALWVIMPQAVLLNVNYWYGFINFQLGLCWVLLMTSLLLRAGSVERTTWQRELVIGALLLLCFFTHMVAVCFCGLLVLLYARQTRRFRILWQLLPSAIAAMWYTAGRYLLAGNADGQSGMSTTVRNFSAAFWAYKANSYLKSFGFINPGLADRSEAVWVLGRSLFIALFFLNLLLAIVLGCAMVWSARTAWRTQAKERFVWLAAIVVLLPALLAPGTALGLSDPGSRLIQVALAPALVLCHWRSGWMRVAAAASVLLAISGMMLLDRAGFGNSPAYSEGRPLPRAIVSFAHAPNHDQDSFYLLLDQGRMDAPIFPTGLFLNQRK